MINSSKESMVPGTCMLPILSFLVQIFIGYIVHILFLLKYHTDMAITLTSVTKTHRYYTQNQKLPLILAL